MTLTQTQRYSNPTAIVIFGGTGDLAQTKLLPALLDLYAHNMLPPVFVIVGLSRKELSDAEYQLFVKDSFSRGGHQHDPEVVKRFCEHFRYVAGNFDEVTSYEKIKQALQRFDDEIKQCTSKLFYLAVPPQFYESIFEHLSSSDAMALCDEVGSWSRILVEKPFGKDLKTAQALEKKLCSLFADDQIYRIDHYLAKDAIENIVSLRFANSILADSWNNEYIESIDIRLVEKKDVANRGSFYDGIGTLRDVGQNHLLQMFALLTMAGVDVHDAHAVRKARATAIAQLSNQQPEIVVRGQYAGFVGTPGVAPDSTTETYFKISFVSHATAWEGVRFTFEAGKALDRNVNEAVITFRATDKCYCEHSTEAHTHQNVLHIQFSPEQRISLLMWTKRPGFGFRLQPQELTLVAEKTIDTHSPEAYERVLYDCISGDQTRFVSSAEVEAAWQFITPILEKFAVLPLAHYEPGSTGPEHA
jgi:glucose-6-phosphate 1-dehydrogenase